MYHSPFCFLKHKIQKPRNLFLYVTDDRGSPDGEVLYVQLADTMYGFLFAFLHKEFQTVGKITFNSKRKYVIEVIKMGEKSRLANANPRENISEDIIIIRYIVKWQKIQFITSNYCGGHVTIYVNQTSMLQDLHLQRDVCQLLLNETVGKKI